MADVVGHPNAHRNTSHITRNGVPYMSRFRHFRSSSAHVGSGHKEQNLTSLGHLPGVGNVHSTQKHESRRKGQDDWMSHGLLSINEKETMQILNDRLASYLEKVHSLEQANAELDKNIRDWTASNQPSSLPDTSQYFSTIQELQAQIATSTTGNANIALHIDNAKWALDDFRNKYEIELKLKANVEEDVNGLRRALGGLKIETSDLEAQVQNLQEEHQEMKKNHEEEVNNLKAQLGQRVNVEVNAAPSRDLNTTLSEIRQQYENLMERNLKEVESMFLARSEELNREVASGAEQLQSVQMDVIDLKRRIQTLEIELQSQLSMKATLESTLEETQSTYSSQLNLLQGMIDNVEAELKRIRSEMERQNSEYRRLMDEKTHIEKEIATYKGLLEGHDTKCVKHLA
ncbi:keratin, type I cuticular Ha5-like [Spea bombifrons]|uniref:keratin, type I cuticular Ha5-like n=1 Tax=Spea bombifrons TaxID=233779 RepID=UPI002349ADB2|nr:keratin, type I cuticular Ha5-like [Spea bombifrons]